MTALGTLDFLIDAIERSMEQDYLGRPYQFICLHPSAFDLLMEDPVMVDAIAGHTPRPEYGMILDGVEIVQSLKAVEPWGMRADGRKEIL